ncbi:MAG: HalOD1 output domain-containing protein [Haloarculaceae archaeon]
MPTNAVSFRTVESPSLTVVEAVAEAEGIEPEALTPPLADAIDPEALDGLFRNGNGRVSFDYRGYEVTVTANGVDVAALAED